MKNIKRILSKFFNKTKMVKVLKVEDFIYRSKDLLANSDHETRFTFKYRKEEAKMYCKTTDDRLCINFITDQEKDFKRVEKFSLWFMENALLKQLKN